MNGRGEAVVRRARHEDWPDVAALLREVDALHAELAPAYFRVGARAETEWRRLLVDGTAAALVAADDRGVVGFLALRIYETPPDPTMVPRRRAHLETLVVSTGARRRGLGRRLVTAAGDWARTQGAVEMVLTTWEGNTAADAFYERLGYRVLSRVLHARL
ncbi:MAG TPA: GNAT family N-acetyltransferase [Polyangia bacterium]|nr:GNAT family N-acetyltransferase [Polyangia bacterium]